MERRLPKLAFQYSPTGYRDIASLGSQAIGAKYRKDYYGASINYVTN